MSRWCVPEARRHAGVRNGLRAVTPLKRRAPCLAGQNRKRFPQRLNGNHGLVPRRIVYDPGGGNLAFPAVHALGVSKDTGVERNPHRSAPVQLVPCPGTDIHHRLFCETLKQRRTGLLPIPTGLIAGHNPCDRLAMCGDNIGVAFPNLPQKA